MWFLLQFYELAELEKEISTFSIESISSEILLEAKQKGFADRQIAHLLGTLESKVFSFKTSDLKVS